MIRRLKRRIVHDLNKKYDVKKHILISKMLVNNMVFARKDTYCSWLWDSVFINYDGGVYTCCKYRPGIIGNINNQSLLNIWTNSSKLKLFRKMSEKKCLPCFFPCNVFAKKIKESVFENPVPLPYPKRLWILHNEFCNLNCIMCGQNRRNKVSLDNRVLKNNVEWERVEEIELQGGEVLASKSAKELYLWLTRQMNKKVNLITNGVLINDEWAEHLIKGSNWIAISVNGASKETHELINRGSNFTRVIDNVKKMIFLKKQYGADVEIAYKFTITLENVHEIGDAIEFANELGCDTIAFGYTTDIPRLLNENRELKEKLRVRINELLNSNLSINIGMKRLEQLDLAETHDYTALW